MIALVLKGDKKLAKALHKLPNAAFNRVIRPANTKVMRPVLRAAKALVPVEYGVLKKSLGIKTKTYPKKGVVWTAIGPRVGFHLPIGNKVKLADGTTRTFTYVRAPIKYAHLVELGHGGPYAAPAHPFLRPAFDGQKATMLAAYFAAVRKGLAREAARASK